MTSAQRCQYTSRRAEPCSSPGSRLGTVRGVSTSRDQDSSGAPAQSSAVWEPRPTKEQPALRGVVFHPEDADLLAFAFELKNAEVGELPARG
jgi:hypothetical protein